MARTVDPEAHARRRDQLLAAAAPEFAAGGLDGASTARICRRAGVGSGTLFHYFPTKAALFHAVFAADQPRVAELCSRACQAADPDAGIDLIVEHLLEEVADPIAPGLASAAYLHSSRDPEFARMLAEIDATRQDALVALLNRVAELPGRRLVFGVHACARWIHGLVDAAHLATQEVDRAEIVDELRRIVDWLVGR